jgi:hypothetical protein
MGAGRSTPSPQSSRRSRSRALRPPVRARLGEADRSLNVERDRAQRACSPAERRTQTRTARAIPLVLVGIAGASMSTLVYLRDPHVPGSWLGECPLVYYTGLACSLCGGLRGTWSLLHGNVVESLYENPLVLLLFAFAGGYLSLWAYAIARGRPVPRVPPFVLVILAASVVTWSVWANVRSPG